MRVAFDGLFLQFSNYQAGLYQYTFNLVKSLAQVEPKLDLVMYFYNALRRPALERHIRSLELSSYGIQYKTLRLPWSMAVRLSQFRLLSRTLIGAADIFHGTAFRLLPATSFHRLVVTIHDLKFITHPESFSDHTGRDFYRRSTENALEHADAIIAVSEFVRREICRYYPFVSSRVRVIWNGVGPQFAPIREPNWFSSWLEERGILRPYFLFVGYPEPNKNIPLLFQALNRLRHVDGQIPHLVLVGGISQHTEELQKFARELNLSSYIHWLGHIRLEELVTVYNGALAMIMPSLYEGFGLPIIEAMACGTPVIASNQGAVKEICGEAALTCDTRDPYEFSEALGKVASDATLRSQLTSLGLVRAREFSWDQCARNTLSVYRDVLR